MASELLELGLTEEELNEIAYVGNKSIISDTPPPCTENRLKQIRKNGSNEKKYNRKKNFESSYYSDSDSSYGSSDNFCFDSNGNGSFIPRGVKDFGQCTPNKACGRGKPFYPDSIQPYLLKTQVTDYNHFNRMKQELNPLIEKMTDSALCRNEAIEMMWSQTKSSNTKSSCDSSIMIDSESKENDLSTDESSSSIIESSSEQICQVKKSPTKGKISDYASVTSISNGSYKNESNNDNNNFSDSTRKRKDIKIKTQLYIPPHLRRKNAEAKGSSSSDSSEVLLSTHCDLSQNIQQETIQDPKSNTLPSPHTIADARKPLVKKSMAERCKNNVLLSGLLRKQQEEKSSATPPLSSSSRYNLHVSTPTYSNASNMDESLLISTSSGITSNTEESPITSRITSNRDESPMSTSFGITNNQGRSPITSSPSDQCGVISSSQVPLSDCCDPDTFSRIQTVESPPTSYLTSNLVEFYDTPVHLMGDSVGDGMPLPPPPEFTDGASTFSYTDPDTLETVYYQIPDTPVDSPLEAWAIPSQSSAFVSTQGSPGGRHSVTSRDPMSTSRDTGNLHTSLHSRKIGLRNVENLASSSQGRGMSFAPSSRSYATVSNSTGAKSSWRDPTSDSYEEEFPSLS
ncbi:hypothetical protein M8J77_004702 [Diaphorina citri]|nr:hypothetical protein M8J77_004702 [Diaphorina citri]